MLVFFMDNNWFELTENKKNINGETLTQIRYLKQIGSKSPGSLGGYIFDKSCLPFECEIDEDTVIFNGCTVGYCIIHNSVISGNSQILGTQDSCENISIKDSSICFGDIKLKEMVLSPNGKKKEKPTICQISNSKIAGTEKENLYIEIKETDAVVRIFDSNILSSHNKKSNTEKLADIVVFGFSSLLIKDSNIIMTEYASIVVTFFEHLNIIKSNLKNTHIHTLITKRETLRSSVIESSNVSGMIVCGEFSITNSELTINISSASATSKFLIDKTTVNGSFSVDLSKDIIISDIKNCKIEGDCSVFTTNGCSSFSVSSTKIKEKLKIVFEGSSKRICMCDFEGENSIYNSDLDECVIKGTNNIRHISLSKCSIKDLDVASSTINDYPIPYAALASVKIKSEIINNAFPLFFYCFEAGKLYYVIVPESEYEITVDRDRATFKKVYLTEVFEKHITSTLKKNNSVVFNLDIDNWKQLHERTIKYNLETFFDDSTKYSLIINASKLTLLTIARLCYIAKHADTMEISGADVINFAVLLSEMEDKLIVNVKTKKPVGFTEDFAFQVLVLKKLPGFDPKKQDDTPIVF